LELDELLSHWSRKSVPVGFESWPKGKQSDWINTNASYVLVPQIDQDPASERVVVYQKIEDSDQHGTIIMFNDNNAQWMPIDKARMLINEQ
jgi:hypothetical protein